MSVACQFSGENDMVDLTSGADSILVNTSIGAVSGMTVDWSEEREGVRA